MHPMCRLALFLTGLLIATGARADMFPTIAADMTMSNLHVETMNRRLEDNSAGTRSGSGTDALTGTPPAKAPPVNRSRDLVFSPSQSVREASLRRFIDKTARTSPAEAENLRNLFASQPRLVDEVGAVMRQHQLDPHNIADAYALWWINVWMTEQLRRDTPDNATIEAVRQQAHDIFLAIPEVGQMTEAQRQEYAEAHIIQAALLDVVLQQTRGNAAQERQVVQAARAGARASGLDLSMMKLTRNGFVLR